MNKERKEELKHLIDELNSVQYHTDPNRFNRIEEIVRILAEELLRRK